MAIRLQMRVLGFMNDAWLNLWGGFLDSVTPRTRRGGYAIVEMRAHGILGLIAEGNLGSSEEASATGQPLDARKDIRADEALVSVLDNAGIGSPPPLDDPNYSSYNARDNRERDLTHDRLGKTNATFNYWFVDTYEPLQACRQIEATELGFINEDTQGRFKFEDRNYRLRGPRLRAQQTFSDQVAFSEDGSNGLAFTDPPRMEDPIRDIANVVRVSISKATVKDEAVLWKHTVPSPTNGIAPVDGINILTATYPRRLSDNIIALVENAPDDHIVEVPNEHIGVDSWTDPVASTDYTANSASDGSGTDITSDIAVTVVKTFTSMDITYTNNHATETAYLTGTLQARGTPLAVTEADTVITKSNTASINKYRKRRYQGEARFIFSEGEADQFARSLSEDSFLETKTATQ